MDLPLSNNQETRLEIKWKCPICRIEVPFKGYICTDCWQNRQKEVSEYKEKLESKRQYSRGVIITTLDKLLEQEWVWWFGKPKHIKVIKNLQLSTILIFLERGYFYKAIKKEDKV